ncbi:MAG: hypothetical protein H6922_04425 [Pseudomonadaceae bacterium]|nr:hypothetical protein [Pseudomonadaceae bacterium]
MVQKPLLPPELAEKAKAFGEKMGPWLAKAGTALTMLLHAGRLPTLGDTFRHLCVVGLNRSELLLAGETTPVFADRWQDLADDNLKRGLGLVFFAPRTLEGKPVNPYLFLTADDTGEAEGAEGNLAAAQQDMAGMGLLDFCRMAPAQPNTVNIVIAADVLFHWDVNDNYVLPTTTTGWVRDVEQVLKGYPRTTKAALYTNWDTDLLPPSERIARHSLRDLPVDESAWLNKPTVQEKYGTHLLALSLLVATGTWFMLHMQNNAIEEVNDKLRAVEQQIPREGRFAEMARAVTEQEKMMQKRDLFYLAVKDAARTVEQAQMKLESFEVANPEPQEPPKSYIVTFEAVKGAYEGWLQEEPIAKDILLNSAMLEAIRKQPGNGFKLEGLIPLNPAWKAYGQLKRPLAAEGEGK